MTTYNAIKSTTTLEKCEIDAESEQDAAAKLLNTERVVQVVYDGLACWFRYDGSAFVSLYDVKEKYE